MNLFVRKISLLLILLAFSAVVNSCNKKKWKEVSSTNLEMQVSTLKVEWGNNYLEIDTFQIQMTSLNLTGKRLQAEDINLSNNLSILNTVTTTSSTQITQFDIPQGTYEPLGMGIQFADKISIKGKYYQSNGEIFNVTMNIDNSNYLFTELLNNGSPSITIDKNNPSTIILTIDSDILFSDLNPGIWNAASVSNVGGSNTIVVSNSNNSTILNQVRSKISSSLNGTIN